MKRASIYILSALFLAAGISACGKTTKGKMVNDWKVTSYNEEMAFVSSNGDKDIHTISMTENSVTTAAVHTPATGPGSTYSQTGTVKLHEWTIKKDGTWSSVQEIGFGGGNSTYTNKIEQSGTWSFLRTTKGDEFGKNERVHFNILQSKSVENSTSGQIVNTNSDEETYLTGEKVMVYTIKSSKKDALEMELENDYRFTQTSGNNNSHTLTRTITLQGK
jgi:hypothetical protein